MVSHVELNDEGAARTAARQLTSRGDQLNDGAWAPFVDFGDDRMGDTMREQYFASVGNGSSLPVECMTAKKELGERLGEIGEATTEALAELDTQERVNAGDIDRVLPPDV